MKVRFLLDENLSPRLKLALHRMEPLIDVLCVGDPGAPGFGTLDPEILIYLERHQRLLVTNNRVSMPGHLTTHWESGHRIWGLIWIKPDTSMGTLIQELHLLWFASEAEEWENRIEWIPF